MSENRIFRAVVTLATLSICLGVLRLFNSRHSTVDLMPPPASAVQVIQRHSPAELQLDSLPPVPVQRLPLAALDNTCFDGSPRDLSAYTGWLSGGSAREYRFNVAAGTPLFIEAEPRFDWFDLSFVLLSENGEAVLACDQNGPGQTEQATAEITQSGVYRLIIGCLGSDCGSYRLAVHDQLPQLTQIKSDQVHRGKNGAVVRWQSFAETKLSHFSLYRISGADRVRVATLRAHGSPAGFAKYRYTDRGATAFGRYELEAVGRDGRLLTVALPS